jgi:hypothetical protein
MIEIHTPLSPEVAELRVTLGPRAAAGRDFLAQDTGNRGSPWAMPPVSVGARMFAVRHGEL